VKERSGTSVDGKGLLKIALLDLDKKSILYLQREVLNVHRCVRRAALETVSLLLRHLTAHMFFLQAPLVAI
jgi:hypothetical protein